MSHTDDNRWIITSIFAELEQGNPRPFAEALAEDVRWTTRGSSVWSRTFEGKAAVLEQLLGPVRAQLVERVRLSVRRILADWDVVVVEAMGRAMTKTGKPYNNDYCFVYKLAGGKIIEVTEYLDTELASGALRAPWAASA
jgi:ketosteroid isomerase-like protein